MPFTFGSFAQRTDKNGPSREENERRNGPRDDRYSDQTHKVTERAVAGTACRPPSHYQYTPAIHTVCGERHVRRTLQCD
ncbi:hypothetical protein GCM10027598_32580 [Amycolatopsis oliviviridis]|uniref:Uncharacterized protein n=1 Tax=Amycolatopsis oliviviridis TaxID=1471590 RepID=A0ABQ3LTU7_9PSEU|nr:hypothetical protein GCM10017790_47580 [Amycolatopsis oliviviridis]